MQLLLLVVEAVVVVVAPALVDVALAPDLGVALLAAGSTTDNDARAEALDEVGELPRLLLNLLGAGAVLDGVADTGDERLVALLVGGVGRRGGLARRRRDGREEDLARARVGDEGRLMEQGGVSLGGKQDEEVERRRTRSRNTAGRTMRTAAQMK